MKQFVTLLVREISEWRLLLIIVGTLFVLGLVGATVGLNRVAEEMADEHANIKMGIDLHDEDEDWEADEKESWKDSMEEDDWEFEEDDWEFADDEWLSWREFKNYGLPAPYLIKGREEVVLYAWTYMLRGGITAINLSLVFLALFYLVDALYKERSDRSTFFYRSFPVSDATLLSSKLVIGTVGFLGLSFMLGMIWVMFLQIAFPGEFSDVLEPAGFSHSQIAMLDLFGDWFAFHLLQLLWLLPYALYLLLISALVRSRPLLVALGIPLLLALLLRYFVGDLEQLAWLLSNLGALGQVMLAQWHGGSPLDIDPGETLELFGGFGRYIFHPRTAISLLVSAGLAVGTWMAYRRNFSTS
ncbi:MAG: hypothetical protein V3W14_02380 [Candidatus Neomarinimicrobiota bacterium]